MGLLLSQRGPKATISLVYCMARAASICNTGPTGSTALAGEADGLADCGAEVSLAAEAALSLEHPTPVSDSTRIKAALTLRHKITPALLAAQISKNHVLHSTRRLERPTIFPVFFLALVCALTALPGVDQPHKSNAADIENHHGSSVDGQVHDVSSRAENGCEGNANQHRSANVLEEELGIYHAHHPGKAEHNGHLKDDGEAQNNGEEQLGVGVNGDGGPEICAVAANQKIHGNRKDDLVSEEASGQKQAHGKHKERHDKTFLMPVKSRRDKAPDLVQDHRRSQKNAGHQSDFQVQVEGIG